MDAKNPVNASPKILRIQLTLDTGIASEKRMEERVNSSMIYLIYCKNFCKCHNVLPPSTAIKINKICI
jgi:hypothetical protein